MQNKITGIYEYYHSFDKQINFCHHKHVVRQRRLCLDDCKRLKSTGDTVDSKRPKGLKDLTILFHHFYYLNLKNKSIKSFLIKKLINDLLPAKTAERKTPLKDDTSLASTKCSSHYIIKKVSKSKKIKKLTQSKKHLKHPKLAKKTNKLRVLKRRVLNHTKRTKAAQKRAFLTHPPNPNPNETLTLAPSPKNPNQSITDLSTADLKQKVNRYFQKNQLDQTYFDPKDSFITRIKEEFGISLSDRAKQKPFTFLHLKILWSQLLSAEEVNPAYFKDLGCFEHLIFRTFLFRFGYITELKEYPSSRDDGAQIKETFNNIQQKYKGLRSEEEMLGFALKAVFKKLMHPFSRDSKQAEFFSDMRTIQLDPLESRRFYEHYFGQLEEYARDPKRFQITEKTLRDVGRMRAYICSMAKSPKLLRDVFRFLYRYRAGERVVLGKPGSDPRGFGVDLVKRQKYDIADKVNKRVNNYEIILNQFDVCLDQQHIVRWLGVILRDLRLNPKVKVPWSLLELKEAVTFFGDCLNQAYLREQFK